MAPLAIPSDLARFRRAFSCLRFPMRFPSGARSMAREANSIDLPACLGLRPADGQAAGPLPSAVQTRPLRRVKNQIAARTNTTTIATIHQKLDQLPARPAAAPAPGAVPPEPGPGPVLPAPMPLPVACARADEAMSRTGLTHKGLRSYGLGGFGGVRLPRCSA